MRILEVAIVQLLLIAGNSLLAQSGCSPGFTYPLNRRCRFYLKCDDGLLKMTKCHPGRYFDVSTRSCVPGDGIEDCEQQNIVFGLSKTSDGKSRIARLSKDGVKGQDDADGRGTTTSDYWPGTDDPSMTGTPWPFIKQTTENDYWTGTDGKGLTGTQWPYNSQTTESNYWTGTNGPVMTGTMWPFARTTANSDRSEIGWRNRVTTEDNYWTGTDNPGQTGTLWPDQSITTDGNYWTGTDSTATGTLWPVGTITTQDSSWTGTDSPATGTYRTNFPTFTESSVTYPYSTETVSSFTVTNPTQGPWMTSTEHSTSQTGTEWTVTENDVTDLTASEWTPRPFKRNNFKTTTPTYV